MTIALDQVYTLTMLTRHKNLEVDPVTSTEVTVVTWNELTHHFEAQFTSIEATLAWQAKVTSIFNLLLILFSC